MDVIQQAVACKDTDPAKAESLYRSLLPLESENSTTPIPDTEEDPAKVRDIALNGLIAVYVYQKNAKSLANLSKEMRSFYYPSISKAKAAKIIRSVLDAVAVASSTTSADDDEESTEQDSLTNQSNITVQVELCKEIIQWCKDEKRTFLRQRVESRLAALYLASSNYTAAINMINSLLSEVKRLDDKQHLLEIQLLESKTYLALRNLAKARAALTGARTTANSIYVAPKLQAEIDMQAGIISAEEKDYKTAYSYFYEAFEGFSGVEVSTNAASTTTPANASATTNGTKGNYEATKNLKYMLLCKIMINQADDIASMVSGTMALKFAGKDIDAMTAVANAHKARSLGMFEKAKVKYKSQLVNDTVVHYHLSALYDSLLEQNLLRIVEPFSRVEIEHVATLIKLPLKDVESKISQMILDKKLNGILDQSAGCLEVYDDLPTAKTYQASIDTIANMDQVVSSLFQKVSGLR